MFNNVMEQLNFYVSCMINNENVDEELGLKLAIVISSLILVDDPSTQLVLAVTAIEEIWEKGEIVTVEENSLEYIKLLQHKTDDDSLLLLSGFMAVNILANAAINNNLYELATTVGISLLMETA